MRIKRPSKPYDFMGFAATDVTKPLHLIWFGDIRGPKPYKFIGLRWVCISQTPVVRARSVCDRPVAQGRNMIVDSGDCSQCLLFSA